MLWAIFAANTAEAPGHQCGLADDAQKLIDGTKMAVHSLHLSSRRSCMGQCWRRPCHYSSFQALVNQKKRTVWVGMDGEYWTRLERRRIWKGGETKNEGLEDENRM